MGFIRPMGPCQVTVIKRDLTQLIITKTHGGVRWTVNEEKADIKYDQNGTVASDRMSQGHMNTIELPLYEGDLDILDFIDPSIHLTVDHSTPSKEFVFQSYRIGGLDSEVLVEMRLTQFKGGIPSTDPEDTVIFPACAPQSISDLMFNADTQRAYKLTFRAYPDLRRTFDVPNPAIWLLGDATATP